MNYRSSKSTEMYLSAVVGRVSKNIQEQSYPKEPHYPVVQDEPFISWVLGKKQQQQHPQVVCI